MDLLGFGISQMVTFLLVLVRVAGIFTVAPIFGNVNVTPLVRVGIAGCLAFVFLPMAHFDASHLDFLALLMVIVKEALVGIVMGFLAAMMFAAIQMAGAFIDLQIGFGFANVVDPMMKQHSAVIGQLYNFAATLLFLGLNGHHLMIRGLADSFSVLPLGSVIVTPHATSGILQVFTVLFLASLKIGAPVVGAIFLTDVSLGILARTVPQLNVFVVGFPAKLTVGLLAVFAVLPVTFAVMTGLFGGLEHDLVRLLKYMGG
jgi:flagellar biosynthetic protein FliR